MAKAVAPPAGEDAADAPSGGQSPTDLSGVDTPTLFREVVARIRPLSPGGMVNPRVEWDIPGNTTPGRIPLATPDPELSEPAAEILEVLRDAEGWLNGSEIVRRIDPTGNTERVSGTFQRAIAELKESKLIDSNKQKGYKAKRL